MYIFKGCNVWSTAVFSHSRPTWILLYLYLWIILEMSDWPTNLQTTIVFNSYLFSISLNTYNFDHNLFLHRPIRFSPDTFFRRYVFSPIRFFADTFWRRYVFSQRYVMSTIRIVRRRLHPLHSRNVRKEVWGGTTSVVALFLFLIYFVISPLVY